MEDDIAEALAELRTAVVEALEQIVRAHQQPAQHSKDDAMDRVAKIAGRLKRGW